MSVFGGNDGERALTPELLAGRADETKRWLLWLARAHFGARQRAAFYRFLASYVERDYFLDQALTAIYLQDTDDDTRRPRSVVSFAIPVFLNRMKMEGASFATAFDGWAPAGEIMALHAFEEGGLKAETLRYLAHSIGASEKTAREIKKVYFRILWGFVSFQVLAYLMAYYILPKIYRAIPAKAMSPTLLTFKSVFDTFAEIGPFLGVASMLVPIGLWYALPNLIGPVRERIDRWPVFSTYRTWAGSVWLRSLTALVAAKMQIPAAMEAIAGRGTPYMNYFVEAIQENLSASLPDAMKRTGHEWPSAEMITALGIFLEGRKPEDALQLYADEWLAEGHEKVNASLANLRTLLYLGVALGGLWFVYAVNEIMMAFTQF